MGLGKIKVLSVLVLSAVTLIGFQNCGQVSFDKAPSPSAPTQTQSSSELVVKKSCVLGSQTIKDGESVIAYREPSVASGQNCLAQNRTCADGVLSGSFANLSCHVAAVEPPPPPAGPMVSCAAMTVTVPTTTPNVYCTDTLAAYSGVQAEVYSPRMYREGQEFLGPNCSLKSNITTYYGTVSGGQYGVCLNYCAVRATCTATGWKNFGFTW